MKKTIAFYLLFAATISVQGQSIANNAIGLRLGDNDGFGGEISYQRKIHSSHRLELDLGIRNNNAVNALKFAALYQKIWKIDGGFNCYAGFGGGLGSWSYDSDLEDNNGNFGFFAGDLGLEYDFEIPLQLSLDIRPELYFGSSSYRENNFGPDVALGIRFQF